MGKAPIRKDCPSVNISL